MFTVQTAGGDVVATFSSTEPLPLNPVEMAIQDAKTRLSDDPELGELTVYAHVEGREIEIGCATFVPDADWQSVVGWLWPGERITPPGPIPAEFRCDPDESCGYDLSDPKHPDWHSVHADIWDAREKG